MTNNDDNTTQGPVAGDKCQFCGDVWPDVRDVCLLNPYGSGLHHFVRARGGDRDNVTEQPALDPMAVFRVYGAAGGRKRMEGMDAGERRALAQRAGRASGERRRKRSSVPKNETTTGDAPHGNNNDRS